MIFSTKLLKWYSQNRRDLPWRETNDPYKIWVSEIMLQQTTVKAVIPFYKRWLEKFPDVKSLARAKEQAVLKNWEGLGYYNRARNLHKASKIIVSEYNGKLPSDPEILKTLPGFGPYTTGAVASIAFGVTYPIVDANVRRVVMRITGTKGKATTKIDNFVYAWLEDKLPTQRIGDFNQALMELGALVCTTKTPACNTCPFIDDCAAFKQGIQEIIPEPNSKQLKTLNVVVGVVQHKGKIYIQQRTSKGLLNGLWEFPGGKIEIGENKLQALKREIKEETGMDIAYPKHLIDVTHYYTQFKVNISAYHIDQTGDIPTDLPGKWVRLREFSKLPMPSGTVKIVKFLEQN